MIGSAVIHCNVTAPPYLQEETAPPAQVSAPSPAPAISTEDFAAIKGHLMMQCDGQYLGLDSMGCVGPLLGELAPWPPSPQQQLEGGQAQQAQQQQAAGPAPGNEGPLGAAADAAAAAGPAGEQLLAGAAAVAPAEDQGVQAQAPQGGQAQGVQALAGLDLPELTEEWMEMEEWMVESPVPSVDVDIEVCAGAGRARGGGGGGGRFEGGRGVCWGGVCCT